MEIYRHCTLWPLKKRKKKRCNFPGNQFHEISRDKVKRNILRAVEYIVEHISL